MSPNGKIYFKDWYCDDFSGKSFQYQHIFIHEMAHVWQFQCGKWVRTRGLASGFISYEYRLEKSKQLLSYRLEQQAQIIADFFLLDKFGVDIWLNNRGIDKIVSYIGPIKPNIYEDYKHVLRDFLTL
ncbi:type VI secretion protein [Rosenbergiella collisarenosi]|uniref:type VI secretion protein n=1 Tax=Rosenbergiella collisarenosi TaxID=1544695 RepID=UPI001F4F03E9|nr:type VI secretion protein [Rosenbergiella collisarenosi]